MVEVARDRWWPWMGIITSLLGAQNFLQSGGIPDYQDPIWVPEYLVRRAQDHVEKLSSYLVGNWSSEFDGLLEQLQVAIVTLKSTRMDAGLAERLASWITTAMNHLREWVGIGALTGIMVLTSLGMLEVYLSH
ncbi:Envelope glycoprotein [Lemmus lemmus]